MGLGTLPSDIYLKSSVGLTIAADISKILIGGLFVASGYFLSMNDDTPKVFDKYMYAGFIPGITIASLIYAGEIISHGLSVNKYNRGSKDDEDFMNKMKKKKFSFNPIIWKNQAGLAFLYNF